MPPPPSSLRPLFASQSSSILLLFLQLYLPPAAARLAGRVIQAKRVAGDHKSQVPRETARSRARGRGCRSGRRDRSMYSEIKMVATFCYLFPLRLLFLSLSLSRFSLLLLPRFHFVCPFPCHKNVPRCCHTPAPPLSRPRRHLLPLATASRLSFSFILPSSPLPTPT